jgi:hypothetical protein
MGASPPSAARLPNEAVRLSPSTHTEPTGPAKQHVGVDVDLPLGGCVLLSPQAVEAYCMDEYSAPPRPPLAAPLSAHRCAQTECQARCEWINAQRAYEVTHARSGMSSHRVPGT